MQKFQLLWKNAFWILISVLLNAFIGIFSSGIMMYGISKGNFFSGKPPNDQSLLEFAITTSIYSSLISSFGHWMATSAMFLPLHFIQQPNERPTFFQCMWRVWKRTAFFYLLTFPANSGVMFFFVSIAKEKEETLTINKMHLHAYFIGIILLLVSTAVSIAMQRLYHEETVEGAKRIHHSNATICTMTTTTTTTTTTKTTTTSGSTRSSSVYVHCKKSFRYIGPIYFAMAYVHVCSNVELSTSKQLFFFCLLSLFVKSLIKTIARSYTMHQKRPSLKTIYTIVGMPTVFIDTQIRVMILRAKATSIGLQGSIALTIIELSSRLGKVLWTRRRISQKEQMVQQKCHQAKISFENVIAKYQPSLCSSFLHTSNVLKEAKQADCAEMQEVQDVIRSHFLWKNQLLDFQAAEIHADMSAEYIAILSSALIHFFVSNHPKFVFMPSTSSTATTTNTTSTTSTSSSSSSSSSSFSSFQEDQKNLNGIWSQIPLALVQIGSEILIDYISILFELATDVPFKDIKRIWLFIAVVLIGAANLNMMICSLMFLLV
jgi:hypothetical protein